MKTLLIPVALLLTVTLVLNSGCATSHSHSVAWEYKIAPTFEDSIKRESAFNDLGKDGWVLITLSPDGTYIFKRPKK